AQAFQFRRQKGGRHAPLGYRFGIQSRGRFGLGAGQGTHCSARHGLVPRRRAGHRDRRPADQGGRVHTRRRAREDGPERQVSSRADVRAVLLLMWHGGGLTGATYETTPDGREGWLTYFIRKGWDTYISDAVERGRAGWTDTFKGDALALPLGDPWERFRVGPPGSWNDDKAKRRTYAGVQFPI